MDQTTFQKKTSSLEELKPKRPNEKVSYKEKWQPVIEKLVSDERYAANFFFGVGSGLSAAPVVSLLTSQICKTYGLDIDRTFVCSAMYTGLWDNGEWSRIKNYGYKSDFMTWLLMVSSQVVFDRLKEEGYICSSLKTASNVRLRLLSQSEHIRKTVVDLIALPEWHNLLKAYYVDKMQPDEIKKQLGLSDELYSATKIAAENCLKQVLLDTEEGKYYADLVLSDKVHSKPMDNAVQLDSLGDRFIDDNGKSPIAEFFDSDGTGEHIDSNIVKFLYDFVSTKMHWCKSDVELWGQRFIHNVSPVDIAERIGRTRAYVDNRFSILCRQFKAAIRQWWYAHVERCPIAV